MMSRAEYLNSISTPPIRPKEHQQFMSPVLPANFYSIDPVSGKRNATFCCTLEAWGLFLPLNSVARHADVVGHG